MTKTLTEQIEAITGAKAIIKTDTETGIVTAIFTPIAEVRINREEKRKIYDNLIKGDIVTLLIFKEHHMCEVLERTESGNYRVQSFVDDRVYPSVSWINFISKTK